MIIRNIGFLTNIIVYDDITETDDFDSSGAEISFFNSAIRLSSDTIINFRRGADVDGFCRTFSIASDGTISFKGSDLEFDTDRCQYNCAVLLDNNVVINFWQGTDLDGFAQIFSINNSTGDITALGSKFEFYTTDVSENSCAEISNTRVINTWSTPSNGCFARVYDVNTSTGAISGLSTDFSNNVTDNAIIRCIKLQDNEYLTSTVNSGGTTLAFRILNINASTGVISGRDSNAFNTDASLNYDVSLIAEDYFLYVFVDGADVKARVFRYDLTTGGDIFKSGSELTVFSGGGGSYGSVKLERVSVKQSFLTFVGDSQSRSVLLNHEDKTDVSLGSSVLTHEANSLAYPSTVLIKNSRVVSFYNNSSTSQGVAKTFDLTKT